MTIKQEFLRVQREITKVTKQIDKIANTIGKKEAQKVAVPKSTKSAKEKTAIKRAPRKAAIQKKITKGTDYGKVLDLITASKDGIDTKSLMQQTGFSAKKIANIIYKGTKSDQIKAIERGVYAAAV